MEFKDIYNMTMNQFLKKFRGIVEGILDRKVSLEELEWIYQVCNDDIIDALKNNVDESNISLIVFFRLTSFEITKNAKEGKTTLDE